MRVQVSDIRMFFDAEGARLRVDGAKMREMPTLLMLHGGPGFDHSIFKPKFSALTDVAQVVYLDHRGNGRSDRGRADRWNLAQWGDDVRAFCEALEIQRPIVMGTSFGGMVAMSYATRHPDHPAKLVLCSTAGKMRIDRSIAEFERLGGAAARDTAKAFFENPGPETMGPYIQRCFPLYQHAPMDPNTMGRSVMNEELAASYFRGEIHTYDFLPALGRIRCPTLVIAGEDDPITPIACSEDIVAALPKSVTRFERFAKVGQGVIDDAPDRFYRVLREFIQS
jgi:pimeloyl-ACP methyl ester carboxylesterase